MKRNIIDEIEFKKLRQNNFVKEMALGDLKTFEETIHKTFNASSDLFPLDYIPVTICSALESFFRAATKDIIDNTEFEMNKINLMEELRAFKFNFIQVNEIVVKKISLGELISHVVIINSIYNVNNLFSILLNINFFKTLKSFRTNFKSDRYLSLINYWGDHYNQILKDLQSVYEVRNITCHEFGFVINISKEVLCRYLRNSIVFLEIVFLYLNTPKHNQPRKNKRMLEVTYEKRQFLKLEKELDSLVSKIRDAPNKVWFDTGYLISNLNDEIILWKQHRKKLVKTIGIVYCASDPSHTMYWHQMQMLTAEKINSLLERYQYILYEMENSSKIQSFI